MAGPMNIKVRWTSQWRLINGRWCRSYVSPFGGVYEYLGPKVGY